jgi:hypothetical protein
MSRYVVWVTEEVTKKVWFDADDYEQAEELLGQIESGELDVEDLPESSEKIKASDFSWGTIERIEE